MRTVEMLNALGADLNKDKRNSAAHHESRNPRTASSSYAARGATMVFEADPLAALNMTERKVMLYLLTAMDGPNRGLMPSARIVARDTKLSRAVVGTIVERLKALGLINTAAPGRDADLIEARLTATKNQIHSRVLFPKSKPINLPA